MSYVRQIEEQIEAFAAIQKDGATTYQAVIVGNAGAGLRGLTDVAGKDMASATRHPPPAI